MWTLIGETTSSEILSFGYNEAPLMALMLSILKPGMKCVDVGAHLGSEALLACLLVSQTGTVVAFEPQPLICAWTKRNLECYPQCRVVEAALGEFSGSLEFPEMDIFRSAFSGRAAASMTAKRIPVTVTTLDEALRRDERPVDFLKCDVEGAELFVLRGADDVLKRDQPFLVLEAEMPGENVERTRVKEFERFLTPYGYERLSFDFDGQLRVTRHGIFSDRHPNVAFVPKSKTSQMLGARKLS
jgi:FkbM family methyltransferase